MPFLLTTAFDTNRSTTRGIVIHKAWNRCHARTSILCFEARYIAQRSVELRAFPGLHLPVRCPILARRRFVITGMLTKEYLRFLWREVKEVQDEEVFGRLVDTMALHDAMFPCEKNGTHEEGEFVVPARLPASVACASLAELEKKVSQGTRMQFVIAIHAGYVPPGIIPQFLGELKRRDGGISGNFVFHVSWNRGVAFMTAGQEILVRLAETCASSQSVVEVNIAGDTAQDVCNKGSEIKKIVVHLLEERYPGLDFDPEAKPTFLKGREAWLDIRAALRGDLIEEVRRGRLLVWYVSRAFVGLVSCINDV